jgi:hypothetical protein
MNAVSFGPHRAEQNTPIAWKTAASPPEFAPPVHESEDRSTLCVVFDVSAHDPDRLAIEVTDQAIVIHGDASPHPRRGAAIRRYVALPPGFDAESVDSTCDGRNLVVWLSRVSNDPEILEEVREHAPRNPVVRPEEPSMRRFPRLARAPERAGRKRGRTRD